MNMNMDALKGLYSKLMGTKPMQFIANNKIPFAAGAGGLAAGIGAMGIGNAISDNIDEYQLMAAQGYVGEDMAPAYMQNVYGVNPAVPSDIASLPPAVFKQLILDPRHGGMYNPNTGGMVF